MISSLEQVFLGNITSRVKQNHNGWKSFNAICCTHNGETQDRRGRGGLLVTDTSFTYKCFNCQFKTGYKIGGAFGFKMRNLFQWAGISDNAINSFVFEALRIKDGKVSDLENSEFKVATKFQEFDLPENCFTMAEWEHAGCDFEDFNDAKRYLRDRGYDPMDSRFSWTPSNYMKMNRSIIIPYSYKGKNVGYTSRTIDSRLPKYYNQSSNNVIYGFDHQDNSWSRTIITEGPLDAISIDGLALLGGEINKPRVDLINQLQTEKIFVPDKDPVGYKLIEPALDAGWKVSIPPWSAKDVSFAASYLGKLTVLKLIVEYATTSKIKIRMNMKNG